MHVHFRITYLSSQALQKWFSVLILAQNGKKCQVSLADCLLVRNEETQNTPVLGRSAEYEECIMHPKFQCELTEASYGPGHGSTGNYSGSPAEPKFGTSLEAAAWLVLGGS